MEHATTENLRATPLSIQNYQYCSDPQSFDTIPTEPYHNQSASSGTPSMPVCPNSSLDSHADPEKSMMQLWHGDSKNNAALRHQLSSSTTEDLLGWLITPPELDALESLYPLPPKKIQSRFIRYLRWNFFSVYRRLFTVVLLSNVTAIFVLLAKPSLTTKQSIMPYQSAATAASSNFCVAVLMRNEHVVNILFRATIFLASPLPLVLRCVAAKIYSYGGMHSGCAVAGTLWYIIFCALLIKEFVAAGTVETALAATTGLALALFALILIFAHPTIRARLHDEFEAIHRYGGWSAVLCLWAQTLVLVNTGANRSGASFSSQLIITPSFWFLLAITAALVYPWTRLRLRKVQVNILSTHATRLYFDYTTLESCMAVRLTDAPLKETHGFATIPHHRDDEGEKGFSVIISNAGDWTKKIIDQPPSHLYVKGAPTLGFMRITLIFRKTLIVTTGSGIGPCLSFLNIYTDWPKRVLWSARQPLETYGPEIVKALFRADPYAVMIDTRKTGRGNVVASAYSLYMASGCEAVIVVSNPSFTRKIVYGLEARGVPVFGPIFDS